MNITLTNINSGPLYASLDSKGVEWREWVFNNLQRDCNPKDMLALMVSSGWEVEAARLALDEALTALGKPPQQVLRFVRPYIRTPENYLDCGDIVAQVLFSLQSPRIVLLDNLLSAEECDRLIDLASEKGLKKSDVVDQEEGGFVAHHARTSSGTYFTRSENAWVARIEKRLAQISEWPVTHAEGLQILRYEIGQEYRPHFDWFRTDMPGSAKQLAQGGQRLGTFILYLSDVVAGGSTIFPTLGIEVFPRKGAGVFFTDVDEQGKPEQKSLHGGSPVIKGTKIVATYWQRESVY
ncbi:MAG: 2OG-Fe(II) oxygenase [Nitrosomonas sp.]|nr:2OG-Fe(II) oxygenase [Nitrosomonas sp.]MDP1951535.1 2OG-Fe(II) oxygenase [Nitrosomonas sp.]